MKKSTTKKTATTKKAAKKTVAKAAKKTAKKAAKKAPAKAAKKIAAKAAKPAKTKKQSSGSELAAVAAVVGTSPVDIAAIAYQIYLERIETGTPGDEVSDWIAAEQRVQAARVQAA